METRAGKRRSEAVRLAENQSPKRKRVVLGEISNLANIRDPLRPGPALESKNQKCKTKAKKALSTTTTSACTTADSEDKTHTQDETMEHPQLSVPYASDIYSYLRQMEEAPTSRPFPDYLEKTQTDLNANMRGILVDWLVEVAEEYKLLADTLHLAVSFIDRFLSVHAVSRHRLQLLGVSSMLIASKYEEISPPHVEAFCYITDNTYTKEEVVKMEADVLKSLKFEIGNPTVKSFLRRFAVVASENHKSPNLQLEFLGCYIAELSLLDYSCVKLLPSLLAASVIFLARFIVWPKKQPWNPTLERFSGYKPSELKECVLILHDLYLGRRGGSLQAIREKYKQHKFKFVAVLPSSPEVPLSYFQDQ